MAKALEAVPGLAQPWTAAWLRLSGAQQRCVHDASRACQQAAPADWVPWYSGGRAVGLVPPARVKPMLDHLPGCRMDLGKLLWAADGWTPAKRSAAMQEFLTLCRVTGQLSGWRDEMYSLWLDEATNPDRETSPWLQTERAGFRHLGMLSHAVHINGFCADGSMWCGRRALHKPTDPGRLDNLAAGGLTSGERLLRCAQRELQEEAGLHIEDLGQLVFAGRMRSHRAERDGWHDEVLHVFNIALPSTFRPENQDGEVSGFKRLSPAKVVDAVWDRQFTLDAAAAIALGLGATPVPSGVGYSA